MIESQCDKNVKGVSPRRQSGKRLSKPFVKNVTGGDSEITHGWLTTGTEKVLTEWIMVNIDISVQHCSFRNVCNIWRVLSAYVVIRAWNRNSLMDSPQPLFGVTSNRDVSSSVNKNNVFSVFRQMCNCKWFNSFELIVYSTPLASINGITTTFLSISRRHRAAETLEGVKIWWVRSRK